MISVNHEKKVIICDTNDTLMKIIDWYVAHGDDDCDWEICMDYDKCQNRIKELEQELERYKEFVKDVKIHAHNFYALVNVIEQFEEVDK